MELQKVAFIIFIIVFSTVKETHSCFSYNLRQTITIKTGSPFYQGCQCWEKEDSVDGLKWIDPHGEEIQRLGLGTSTVFTEKQAETGTVSLHIPRVSKSTAGPYTCVTTHKGQKYEKTFLIEAYDPVYFVNTEVNQFLISGQESTIHCEARGDTEPLITWYLYKELDEEELRILDDDKYSIETDGLKIKNVNINDNGTYKCTAAVLETGEEVERNINVEVLTVPVIEELIASPDQTVLVGNFLSIECLAHGFPHPEYDWTKVADTEDLRNGTWKQELNTISFENITAEDRGVYRCTASNKAGEVTKEIVIEVLVPPVIEEFSNITALEGSLVQVKCKTSGRNAPNITVLTEPDGLNKDPNIVDVEIQDIINGESQLILTFHEVKRDYEGRYVCKAVNEVGEVEQEMKFTVLYKPYFREDLQNWVWGWMGKTVNLSCEHESNPRSTISWRHQGNDIETSEQVTINKLLNPEQSSEENNAELQFVTLTIERKSLFGLYECTASNKYGKSKRTIELKEGFPPPELRNYTATEITTNSVTFEIKGPETVNGPPVVGFTAEYDEEENYKITSIHRNRTWSIDRPYRVDRLKPNTTYYFKFAAVNEVGIGIWSNTLKVVTLEPSVPEPPVFEEEARYLPREPSTLSNDANILKWKAPESEEDPIDYYVIKYCPVHNEEIRRELCREEMIAPTSQIDLRQLEQNTTFYIEFLAHNSKGNSSVVEHYFTTPAANTSQSILTAGTMIGLSVLVVVLCILALDLVLFSWRRQGLIASCCYKKNKKIPEDPSMSRDKKGLLGDSNQPTNDDALNRGHKEFEYNKTTGVITGKHSAV